MTRNHLRTLRFVKCVGQRALLLNLTSSAAVMHILSAFFGLFFCLHNALAMYPSSGDVVDLTPSNFDKLVKQSDSVWLVEFYAPWCGHCKSLVPEFSKAARALKGVVKVGAVDADEHKSLARDFSVNGFPTIKVFGHDKNSPEAYNGGRTASELVDAAMKAAKSKVNMQLNGKSSGDSSGSKNDKSNVVELTDSNFDKLVMQSDDLWLVEFFAPWCGHCKNLEPQWAKAANELKGKVKLGALDATVNQVKASQYGVQGYPTIKMFGAGKKDSMSVVDYDGGRTASDIVNWALDKLAANIPAPELIQLVSEKTMQEACGDKPLCVISVLPHILDCDAACRNAYLDILKQMGEKYKQKMWGWAWSEGGSQPGVEDALEIGGFGYPAMAVVNPKKLKYSLLRGSFSQSGINEFLRDLSYGKGQTAPVKGAEIPKIYSCDPWDGKDGELPQEEDIDLSDVDLDKEEL